MFLIFEKFVGLVWSEMEAGVKVIAPHRHPFQRGTYYIPLGLFKAKRSVPGVLIDLQIILRTVSVSAFTVQFLFLQSVEIDVFSLLD